jgi:glutaredoxin 3
MTEKALIYGLTNHNATNVAEQFLQQKGVADIEMAYIDVDPVLRKEMWARTERSRTIPQIYIGATHIGTLSEMVELDRAGGLDPLLNAS